MGDAVCITVSAKPRLLDLGKFPQEVLICPRCFDDLVGGKDKLVLEVGPGEVEMPGGRTICHDPGPVGGPEGTRALGGELVRFRSWEHGNVGARVGQKPPTG